jgi:RsiW-degrading membrane proteinase PrsW (M82 family)
LAGSTALIVPALASLLPVLCFLAVLLLLDSYKLVKLRAVLAVVAGGALMGGAAYVVNGALLGALDVEFRTYSRFAAPFVEEALKALIVIALIRTHRIGFLVDAAIFGFAVGTGFALVENLHYLQRVADAHAAPPSCTAGPRPSSA